MCIEDGCITDVYDELINLDEDNNMIIENNNEEERINLKRKLENDNEIKIKPKKFIANVALI